MGESRDLKKTKTQREGQSEGGELMILGGRERQWREERKEKEPCERDNREECWEQNREEPETDLALIQYRIEYRHNLYGEYVIPKLKSSLTFVPQDTPN